MGVVGISRRWATSRPSILRPKTWKQYSQVVHQHIIPHLGMIKLKDLRPDRIQSFYSVNLEAVTSERTLQLIHDILHSALTQALKWSLITRNPSNAVDKPKLRRKEMKVLDADQVRALLNAAGGDRLEALYHLAVTTGLRQGELLGLRWSDLDCSKKLRASKTEAQKLLDIVGKDADIALYSGITANQAYYGAETISAPFCSVSFLAF